MGEQTERSDQINGYTTLYTGDYLDLRKMKIGLPDGRIAYREIVKVRDAVAVLPLTKDGMVHLVRQYRPAIGRTILEIPAGLIDEGEDSETAAKRECEEETGFVPRCLDRLYYYAHAEGYSTGFMTLYLGTELEYTGRTHFDSSEHLEPVTLSYSELGDLVKTNRIFDSKTILTVFLAATRIDKIVT